MVRSFVGTDCITGFVVYKFIISQRIIMSNFYIAMTNVYILGALVAILLVLAAIFTIKQQKN